MLFFEKKGDLSLHSMAIYCFAISGMHLIWVEWDSNEDRTSDLVFKIKRIEMKIFQAVLRAFAPLGLGPQSTAEKYPINRINSPTLFILCLATCLCCGYLLYEANTFQDFAMSVYITSAFLTVTVMYSFIASKNHEFCGLLTKFEWMIDESEKVDCGILSKNKY